MREAAGEGAEESKVPVWSEVAATGVLPCFFDRWKGSFAD